MRGVIMNLAKGKRNDLTDIQGVKVGHVTLYEKIDDGNPSTWR